MKVTTHTLLMRVKASGWIHLTLLTVKRVVVFHEKFYYNNWILINLSCWFFILVLSSLVYFLQTNLTDVKLYWQSNNYNGGGRRKLRSVFL